eukprot:jgi/Bigna1/143799/aug1.81_g18507
MLLGPSAGTVLYEWIDREAQKYLPTMGCGISAEQKAKMEAEERERQRKETEEREERQRKAKEEAERRRKLREEQEAEEKRKREEKEKRQLQEKKEGWRILAGYISAPRSSPFQTSVVKLNLRNKEKMVSPSLAKIPVKKYVTDDLLPYKRHGAFLQFKELPELNGINFNNVWIPVRTNIYGSLTLCETAGLFWGKKEVTDFKAIKVRARGNDELTMEEKKEHLDLLRARLKSSIEKSEEASEEYKKKYCSAVVESGITGGVKSLSADSDSSQITVTFEDDHCPRLILQEGDFIKFEHVPSVKGMDNLNGEWFECQTVGLWKVRFINKTGALYHTFEVIPGTRIQKKFNMKPIKFTIKKRAEPWEGLTTESKARQVSEDEEFYIREGSFLNPMAKDWKQRAAFAQIEIEFGRYDTDNSGYISRDEFAAYLTRKARLSSTSYRMEQAVTEAMKEFDTDGDGKVSFREFLEATFRAVLNANSLLKTKYTIRKQKWLDKQKALADKAKKEKPKEEVKAANVKDAAAKAANPEKENGEDGGKKEEETGSKAEGNGNLLEDTIRDLLKKDEPFQAIFRHCREKNLGKAHEIMKALNKVKLELGR